MQATQHIAKKWLFCTVLLYCNHLFKLPFFFVITVDRWEPSKHASPHSLASMWPLMQRSHLFCYFGSSFPNSTRQYLAETKSSRKSHELKRSQLWQQQRLVNLATAKMSNMSCCFICWMKSAVLFFFLYTAIFRGGEFELWLHALIGVAMVFIIFNRRNYDKATLCQLRDLLFHLTDNPDVAHNFQNTLRFSPRRLKSFSL